jgi:hypothetical protein
MFFDKANPWSQCNRITTGCSAGVCEKSLRYMSRTKRSLCGAFDALRVGERGSGVGMSGVWCADDLTVELWPVQYTLMVPLTSSIPSVAETVSMVFSSQRVTTINHSFLPLPPLIVSHRCMYQMLILTSSVCIVSLLSRSPSLG